MNFIMKFIKRLFNPLGISHGIKRHINHLRNPHRIWRKLKKLGFRGWLKLFGKVALGFFVTIVVLFVWYSKDLPAISKLKTLKSAQSTQILDRNGELLYAISGEKQRMIIPSDQIPDYVKKAAVSIEDQDFYQHRGLDFSGVFRAIYYNLTGKSRFTQGGSTITQQYVKNALLNPKKTYSRKIKELILSLELEMMYSKDKILEMYLNEIPYGSTAYGIEAASRKYFGKPAKNLTLEESATLAALPQAPTFYSPYGANKDKLLKRKDLVLEKMAKLGYITKDEAEKARQAKITFTPLSESLIAPHFVFYIREYLAEKYGEKMVEEGGLKVTTTLDIDTQKKALDAIEAGSKKLDRYGANNAALVAIDPSTGQVLAMVGSRDYFNDDIDGQVNVTTSNRQPGSSFKPIVYATAFKDKYNPAFTLFDLTTDFGGGYVPNNYDGSKRGPVSMRLALANSLNIPAVKTLGLVGVKKALETAADLGITTLTQPDRYGLSLVLGGGEVKPIEMAGAFSVFANGGKKAPLTGILKVEDDNGKILEEFKTENLETKPVLDPQIAYQINNILSDNHARGAVFGFTNNLSIPGKTVAVKTGTTQEFHDAWTVGYTPQISTAVWVGNTNNDGMKKGADGSVVAAPIWNAFMKSFLLSKENKGFDQPSGIREIEVDKLSNKLPTADSPEIIKDIFTSWQAPDKKDDIHIRVKINKLNGKLATEFTPKEVIEEKLYTEIHSEKPQNSNWEGPVLAWAAERGMDNQPPTEKDDMYNSLDKLPVMEIIAPTENSTTTGETVFSASASAHFEIREVAFSIDNIEIGKATSSPYSLAYNVNGLSVGEHTLTAFAFDKNGASAYKQIKFLVSPDTSGPKISNILVSATANSAIISFTTDKPSQSYIQYGLINTTLNAKTVTETTGFTNHSLTLANLNSATVYYFKIVSQDSSANSATSSIYNFKTK
ncbi:MAG: 1A family penicillin-binding protein [Candidatus Berkelbacteria bacterium Licking1014_7]|uniref:1A family penicillin-binding protein n=1 Tax=Candidatus Berkelbacteria bacterium Licking1014_7 TaxID=2017147 RepID=A0A554LJX6_9BACT|nr:MAG: 1A family penicillin-binding protein [Candidatus Berkelbacteria bacterium Licking1014_7]